MLLRTNKPSPTLQIALPLSLCLLLPATACAETPFEASHNFIESGRKTEARRALETELRLRPNNLEARYNLAVLLEESGHSADAIGLYEKNLTISWHLPSLINLAVALKDNGKTKMAETWLIKGTKGLTHEATPWYILAQISEQNGDTVNAARQYLKALKADPINGFAHLNYATFQSKNRHGDLGVKHGAKATRLLPNCAPCWSRYGSILQGAGKDEQAIEAYQRSLAINPEPETRKQLIKTLKKLGHLERAQQMQRGMLQFHSKQK